MANFKVLKDWASHKKGEEITLIDEAVIEKALELKVIESVDSKKKVKETKED